MNRIIKLSILATFILSLTLMKGCGGGSLNPLLGEWEVIEGPEGGRVAIDEHTLDFPYAFETVSAGKTIEFMEGGSIRIGSEVYPYILEAGTVTVTVPSRTDPGQVINMMFEYRLEERRLELERYGSKGAVVLLKPAS